MGWRASFIVTGNCEAGYLGTLPEHSKERAEQIIKKLGYSGFSKRRVKNELDFHPPPKTFAIGAYEHATFIADQDIIFQCLKNGCMVQDFDPSEQQHPFLKKALRLYPKGKLLIVALHSVTGYFGYAYFENGTRLREYTGDDSNGITTEFGSPQPEEKAYLQKNTKLKYGKWHEYLEFSKTWERTSAVSIGHSLSFEMTRKFFGEPFNHYIYTLRTELFSKRRD